MEPDTAVREFEEAVSELKSELERLNSNIQSLTEYQTSVFQVTKVLCTWMDNIEGLARQRSHHPVTHEPLE